MASALREVLAKFGFEVDDSKLSAAIKTTDNFTAKVVGLAEKFAGGSVLGAVKEMISDLQAKAGEIRGTAAQLGITNQEFQKLQFTSGASAETLSSAFRVLQKQMAAAGGGAKGVAADIATVGDSMEGVLGNKAAKEVFKSLKIDLTEAGGAAKTPINVFGELASKIGDIQDPAVRTATALKVFGRNGQALLPYFAKGGEELRALAEQFDELGGGLSDKTISALKDQAKAQKALNMASLSLKSALAEQLVPWFTKQIQTHAKLITWIGKTLSNTNALKAAVLVIGAAMAWQGREALLAGAKTALAYAPVAIALALLILLIDDVITTLDGGDSVIKRTGKSWLEWISGSKASAEVNQDVWDAFLKSVTDTSWTEIFSGALDYWLGDIVKSLDAAETKFTVWLYSLRDMDWKGLGYDIVMGIVAGMVPAPLQAAVTSLGQVIKSTFAKFFDAHSPSRVMSADTKVMLGGGVVKGLADSEDMIRAQAKDTYSAAMLPSAQYAPTVKASGGGSSAPAHVEQNNTNRFDIRVEGGGGRDIADSIRDGLAQPLNDSRQASLAALEDLISV